MPLPTYMVIQVPTLHFYLKNLNHLPAYSYLHDITSAYIASTLNVYTSVPYMRGAAMSNTAQHIY
jgi:hypothetical protein